MANPKHKNVVTILVSATPYCLLSAHSRVPRVGRPSAPDDAGRQELVNLDTSPEAMSGHLEIQDVHVVDWSETLRRALERPGGVTAHLRCYVLPAGSEDGYFYVTATDDGSLVAQAQRSAEAGGTPVTLTYTVVQGEGQQVLVSVEKGEERLYVGYENPVAGAGVRLVEDEASACRMVLHLGLGEGLVALRLAVPIVGPSVSQFRYLRGPVFDEDGACSDPRLGWVDYAANINPLPVICQFRLAFPALAGAPQMPNTYVRGRAVNMCCAATARALVRSLPVSGLSRYKSVGFMLNTLRHRNPAVWRMRSDPTFRASISRDVNGGDLQLISDYVYNVLYLGKAWQLSGVTREYIVTHDDPTLTLPMVLYNDALEGTVDDVFESWYGRCRQVLDAVDAFCGAAATSGQMLVSAEVRFRVSSHWTTMASRLQQQWEAAKENLLEQFQDVVDSDVLLWSAETWLGHLTTSSPVTVDAYLLSSPVKVDAYLKAASTGLAVAKHALGHPGVISSDEGKSVLSFLQTARQVVHGIDLRCNNSDSGVNSATYRVWVVESSLCTELAIRKLSCAKESLAGAGPARILEGHMSLVRLRTTANAKLLEWAVTTALNVLGVDNPVCGAFAIIADCENTSLKRSFDSPNHRSAAWFQRLQGGK